MIKLSEWAKQNALSYSGAYNLFKQNKLPVKSIQLPTGTILVEDNPKTAYRIVDVKSNKSFTIELDLDLNANGLSGQDQLDILNEIRNLAELIKNKLNFGVELNKIWTP